MLKKSFTRLNQKASSRRRSRRNRYLKIAALSLMLTLSVGAVFGLWSNSSGTRKPQAAALSPMLQPVPAIPSPSNPSKEYIYAGGKLIATEEPSSNASPNVSIAAPANNFTFPANSNLLVTVNASDPDGSITQVQILVGGTPLGLATAAGGGIYNFTWTNVPAGTYSLTANATDNSGAVGTSAAISIIANAAPTVSITSPANNAPFTAPASITITANATDSDGSISQVEFYQGATLIGTDTTSPYSVTWNNVPVGTYSLTARATDNSGAVTPSASVSVTVNPAANVPPTVSITSPANNTVLNAPATITVNASASDSDGTISKVEFFQDGTLIGTDTTSPYSATVSGVPSGTYSMTARATDNSGGVATSAPVTVISNALPTVSVTSPANNTILNAPATVTVNVSASDSDGTITKVDFYQDFTLVGTDTTAPYSLTLNNLPAGTYSLSAQAADNRGAVVASLPVTFISNALPTATLTAPANNTVLNEPASVTISANASDSDGTITKVEFYQGASLIGTVNNAPYSLTWTGISAGTYSLTAKATDNRGAVGTSAPVTFICNALPTVSITSPANNTVLAAPANFTINANANDSDGTISKVEFYQGATLIGTDTTAPYSVTWSNVSAGTYSLTARATDNRGAVGSSAPVTVISNAAPTASITAPANNAVFTAPANIPINANASDSDGTISKVEFYQGATLIGTATTAPYAMTWTSVPAGTYSLTAKATDNFGAVAVSAPVSITVNTAVNALPTVSITSPANNTVLTAPATININANASDSDGTVTRVDFYQGTTLIGTATSTPYSVTWSNVPAGTYSLTAKATDNAGAIVTSAAVTFISNAAPTVSITSPVNNAIFSSPANIAINANAGDSDGTITKVDFYQGTTLVGTDTTTPYSVSLTNLGVGTYSLSATATDNRGATATAAVVVNVATFYDDFNDNSLDPAKWTVTTPGSPVVVSEQSQQLRITLPPSTSIFYNGITSNAAYDMRGGIAQVELVQPVSQAGWVENSMTVTLDAQNYFMFNVGAGSILFRSTVNGVNDQLVINFDPVAHHYWRVRHDKNANLVNFETSADAVNWTTRKSVTPGFSLVGMKFSFTAGAYGNGNASPGAAIYNDFQFFAGPCTPPGSVLISEFRLRGPNGSNDEYIELYNNSDQAIGVCTTDNSSGWALVSSDGLTRFVVPAGTVIPARGHYLATGGGYSLGAYGGSTNGNASIGVDIPDNTGLALFNSANAANFTLANRLDAVGFTTSGTLYREGAGLAVLGATSGQYSLVRKLNTEIPQDTGDNSADLVFVATDAGNYGGIIAILGAPGPENLLSPQRTVTLPVTMLDPAVGATVAPNRVRDTAAVGPNAAAGTMSLRRTVTNNTGKNVTQLRFRVIDITTLNSPGYTPGGAQADMRVLSSSDFTATLSSGQQVLVRGTTLETPPSQSLGGGLNSTLRLGTVSLAQPLAPGQTMNFQWLLGVQQTGSFRFFLMVEAVVQ